MKITIMGTGGVGGYYGGLLAKAGQDVTFVARGEHLDAILERGLHVVSRSSGEFTVKAKAMASLEGAEPADLIVYCVKGYDNDTAIDLIRPAVGPDTSILTLQNGIGSGEMLAAAFGPEGVLLGASYVDARKTGPGEISEIGSDPSIVFGVAGGGVTPTAERVLEVMKDAGIPATLSEDPDQVIWSKFIYICALSGMLCITRSTFPDIMGAPETRAMTEQVLREAEAVAHAKGVSVPSNLVDDVIAEFDSTGEDDGWSSMRTDLDSGNRLEVSVINGAAARIGREVGVETPANSFIAASLAPAHNRAVRQLESLKDQEVIESWNEIWEESNHTAAVHDKVLEEVAGNLTPGSALEFGCGVGANALWLAEQGWEVTAVDYSDVAVRKGNELAEARGVYVEFVAADATSYRPDREYDLVASFYIQLPPSDRAKMLSASAELLAPGGTLLFVGHDKTAPPPGWNAEDLESLTTVDEVTAELPGLEIVSATLIEDDGAHMAHMRDPDEDHGPEGGDENGHLNGESREEHDHEEGHSHGASTAVIARKPA